jgi:hypothetical protein
VSRYGREDDEWAALQTAGWEFLTTRARLERPTSYTEMNTVLARRTGVREFDFGLDGERHAMGELLGQLSERSLAQAGLLISVLVHYLNANDAGPGFYELAQRKGVLPRGADKLAFWVGHLRAVCAYPWQRHSGNGRRIERPTARSRTARCATPRLPWQAQSRRGPAGARF